MIFIGAPLALASRPLGVRWLFYLGLGLLVVALVIPAEPGRTLGQRLANLVRHLPGGRWLDKKH